MEQDEERELSVESGASIDDDNDVYSDATRRTMVCNVIERIERKSYGVVRGRARLGSYCVRCESLARRPAGLLIIHHAMLDEVWSRSFHFACSI